MVGCIESLQQSAETHGLNLHEEMHKFYNQYYSSDIMKLALYGNQELDQLVEWAVQKFSGVKSKGNTVPKLPEHPVGIEQLGKCIYYETVNDIHQVVIEFPVPETKALYRYDPDIYITHLIGHESTGSLLSYLKQKGWAVGLSAGSNHNDIEGYGKLYISINATPEGLEHHADVVQAVFAYINLAASSGPQEYVFNELCTITKIGFDNRKKIDAVTWVQNYMHIIHNEYLAPEHALSKDSAFEKLDSDAIMHYLAFLNPGNYRLFIGASKHALVKCSDVELHFGTAYHVASLPASLTTELVNNCATIDELCLPAKNPFIPDDLSIKNPNMLGDQAILKPTLLKFNKDIELWFKQDDQFNTPKGSIVLEVELARVTLAKLQAHMDSMFDTTYIKMCMVGNFDEEDALSTARDVQSILKPMMSYIYCGPLINLKDQAISLTVEGEANPAYVTLHINKFVHDMRQKLASISDEQFDNRVASQVNILEERMKNVDEEAGTYYAFISTGSYDFARYGKKVACLKTLVKSNLLEFWDKHINPSTAPDYKRLDSQMWSSKIWCPTASDLATYSSKTLALYGCMRSEGNAELDIAKLDGFINAAVNERMKNPDADVGADDLVEKLKAACLSESGAAYIPGESAEVSAHTRTALQLAINEQDAFFNYELKCQSDFTNIGMAKTPDGVWMLNDGAKFKATQRLHRVNAPVESLVPKYKD
ncbi:metalloprotease [Coemansia thaxteri]|uniref:Metalloprotease n=1 Tax=Coemansia thaxteri TaxID=2663907 RepID=A0A9W8B8V3_9FUNG|nr:metalloprotease [Coemansia thaxteri]